MAGWEVFLDTKHHVALLFIEASRSKTKCLKLDVVASTAYGFEFGSLEQLPTYSLDTIRFLHPEHGNMDPMPVWAQLTSKTPNNLVVGTQRRDNQRLEGRHSICRWICDLRRTGTMGTMDDGLLHESLGRGTR